MLLIGGAIDQPTCTERTNLPTWLQTLPSMADHNLPTWLQTLPSVADHNLPTWLQTLPSMADHNPPTWLQTLPSMADHNPPTWLQTLPSMADHNPPTWLQTLPSVADSNRTSSFLSGGFTSAMALTLKSQGSVASFNSTMISAKLDDVMNAGPGACQVEHTSHRLRVTLSQSSTKTPPAQGLCSNSTTEMFLPACDMRETAQDNVAIGAAPSAPEVE